MKNRTCSPLSQMVSTVKKSQAMIPEACWRRNARQAVADGRGPDPSRGVAWCGSRSQRPACRAGAAPPRMRWSPPARVLAGQPNDQLLQLLVELRSPCCVVGVGPLERDKAAVPAQRLGLTRKPDQREPDRARLNAASRAVGRLEPGTCDLAAEHASWWRSTRSSKSLAASPRASRTSSWMERHSARLCELRHHADSLRDGSAEASPTRDG